MRDTDEEVFVSKEVKSVGQTIGVILASDPSIAKKAARKVIVEYEDLPNPIYSIQVNEDIENIKTFNI